MIRHAAAAAFPVGPLPVAVIEPSLPALLVSPVGGLRCCRRAFCRHSVAAVSGGPGHNDGRSRTPRHSRPPGKTVDAVALRGSPSPPFRRDGTTATRHGKRDLIYRGCSAVFSGRLTVGVFPFRLRPHPTRASASLTDDDGSISHHRRSSKNQRFPAHRCAELVMGADLLVKAS